MTAEQQLIEGAKKEGELVVWTPDWEEATAKAFREKHPFINVKRVDLRPDQAINRLVEEAGVGRHSVDVFIYGEVDIVSPRLKGLLQEYEWPNTRGWPHQPSHNYYRSIALVVRAPIYNSNLIPPAEVPRSWDDLANPRWRGKSFTSLSAQEMPLAFAYMWREGGKLNWDKGEKYWKDQIENTRPKMASGYTGGTELVGAGESLLMVPGSLNVALRFKWIGAPVELVPVDRISAYNRTVAIIQNAPHPNAAKLFADFLTSSDGLLVYSNSMTAPAIPPEVAKKAKANREIDRLGISIVVLPVDILTEENTSRSTSYWLKLLGARG